MAILLGRLGKLQAVAERVVNHARRKPAEVAIPGDMLVGLPQPLNEFVQIADEDAG